MSIDDPFFDSKADSKTGERTLVRPRPGGRRLAGYPPVPSSSSSPPPSPSVDSHTFTSAAPSISGFNPLVGAANVLLLTAGQLRDTISHPDPDMLRTLITQAFTQFENNARVAGVTPEALFTARYLLCTFIDEIVLSTPWGSQSAWNQQTLLSQYHKEVGGGEKFFQIMDKALLDPVRNLELLELIYFCLMLGFKGKYRVQSGGSARIEDIQLQLTNTLRSQRGDMERNLSPNWRGVEDKRNPLARYVPLWVVGAVFAGALLLVWLGFSVSLSRYSDPVMEELQLLGRNIPPIVKRQAEIPKKTQSVSVIRALAAEIKQGIVYVIKSDDKLSIVVRGEGLFAPGRATLKTRRVPLIEKIARVLARIPGPVFVTGHTDDDPISGSLRLKFPSNWDLSQKRAEAVAVVIRSNISSPQRVIAEGLADTEPLVPNDSPENKAHNRRVEISLLLSQ